MATAKKTAIVYLRVSTGGQEAAGTIGAQEVRCKALVEQHGLQVLRYGPKKDGWIRDDGVSGSLLEGRAFSKLIDDLEAGRVKVDALVVYSLSRLARQDKSSTGPNGMAKRVKSATDAARIHAVLGGAGVQVIDGDGVNDPSSVLYELKNTLSGEEYRGIRTKTMDGKARVLAAGGWATGGRVPYGYQRTFVNGKDKKQGTTLREHPEDGPRFRKLMGWFIAGGVTHAANLAMKAGWPSPRGSATWHPSTVQQILGGLRKYLGESTLSIKGQPYVVSYPALIDHELYAAIARRMKERTLKKRTTLLSTGYTDCSCGLHIHGQRSSTASKFYLGCRGRCGTVPEDEFTRVLWGMVVARFVQIQAHEKSANSGADPYGPQLQSAKGTLAKVQEQLDRLVALYAEGKYDTEALTKNTERLRTEKVSAQGEVERLSRAREAHEQKSGTCQRV